MAFTLPPDEQARIRQALADYLRLNPGGSLEGVLQVDAQGRPFTIRNGRTNYESPVSFGAQAPADTTGMLRSAPQWNGEKGEWDTPISWGNIASLGTAGVLTAGAANAFAGGGAAAGSASGGGVGLGETGASVGLTGAEPFLGSAAFNGGMAGSAGAAGARAAGNAAAASGGTDWTAILKRIAPGLAAVIPGAITGALGGGPSGGPSDVPQELRDLLALSMKRVNDQQPLVDATNAQALGGLPRRS